MATLRRVVIGVLLTAHGLVHLLYLTPDVPDFSLEGSWLVPESARRPVAMVLMGGRVRSAVLAERGVPGLSGMWPVIAIVASVLSLALLVAFWSWSMTFGALIDLALIAAAMIRTEWTDRIGG